METCRVVIPENWNSVHLLVLFTRKTCVIRDAEYRLLSLVDHPHHSVISHVTPMS